MYQVYCAVLHLTFIAIFQSFVHDSKHSVWDKSQTSDALKHYGEASTYILSFTEDILLSSGRPFLQYSWSMVPDRDRLDPRGCLVHPARNWGSTFSCQWPQRINTCTCQPEFPLQLEGLAFCTARTSCRSPIVAHSAVRLWHRFLTHCLLTLSPPDCDTLGMHQGTESWFIGPCKGSNYTFIRHTCLPGMWKIFRTQGWSAAFKLTVTNTSDKFLSWCQWQETLSCSMWKFLNWIL